VSRDDETVPCSTCGDPTRMTGTKKCNDCWEVEGRLQGYLRRGGAKAYAVVLAALGLQGKTL
jgi:hypothetical protein